MCVNKNLNRIYDSLTRSDRTTILHMCIPCDKISHGVIVFDLVTLKFDLLLKNFNLGHNFLPRNDRAFILHMCIPCDKTFHMVPSILTS